MFGLLSSVTIRDGPILPPYFAHSLATYYGYIMHIHGYVNCLCTSHTVRLIITRPNILTVLLKYNNLFRSQWQHKTKPLGVAAYSLPFYTAIGYFHNNILLKFTPSILLFIFAFLLL